MELDRDDLGYIEQLTRWRVQEIDATEPQDKIHQIERQLERAHLMMLRNKLGMRNDATAMAKTRKR